MKIRSWSESSGAMLVPSTFTGWYRKMMITSAKPIAMSKSRVHTRTSWRKWRGRWFFFFFKKRGGGFGGSFSPFPGGEWGGSCRFVVVVFLFSFFSIEREKCWFLWGDWGRGGSGAGYSSL